MKLKKTFVVLLVVFLGYWMFTDPNGLADAASGGADTTWAAAQDLFGAVIDFVDAL
ncbi:hypothetical protein [uncultured Nocardioides sp.]|uniref:hypothetical protein n=1 Tax=uncultured Nocardioides sp. TaxID=198441 RepID=UPI0025CE17A2|nr:hypothetical protein [uncultured Nocardioides sp.]